MKMKDRIRKAEHRFWKTDYLNTNVKIIDKEESIAESNYYWVVKTITRYLKKQGGNSNEPL